MEQEILASLPLKTEDATGPRLDMPFWDAEMRRLHFRGECIKAFTGPAQNQEAILSAFQRSGWGLINNPLPSDPEVLSHRQLEYAVRRLNSNQHPQQRLRFRVCDYNTKIFWEALCEQPRARKRFAAKKKRRRASDG